LHGAHSLDLRLRLISLISLSLVTLLGGGSSSGLVSGGFSVVFLSLRVGSSSSLSAEDGLFTDFSHSLGLSDGSLLLGFFVTRSSGVGLVSFVSGGVLLFVITGSGGGGLFISRLLSSLGGLLGGSLLGRALGLGSGSAGLGGLGAGSTLGSSSFGGFTGAGSLGWAGGLGSGAGLFLLGRAGSSLGGSLGRFAGVSGGVLSELVLLQESLSFGLGGSHSSGSLDSGLLGGSDGSIVLLGDGVLGGLCLIGLR